jgi:hypothetical protein
VLLLKAWNPDFFNIISYVSKILNQKRILEKKIKNKKKERKKEDRGRGNERHQNLKTVFFLF